MSKAHWKIGDKVEINIRRSPLHRLNDKIGIIHSLRGDTAVVIFDDKCTDCINYENDCKHQINFDYLISLDYASDNIEIDTLHNWLSANV